MTPENALKRVLAKQENPSKASQVNLDDVAAITAPWPTPNAMAGGSTSRSGDRKDELLISGLIQPWNTPRATDGSKGGPNQTGGALPADAAMSGWATPAARDYRSEVASNEYNQERSQQTRGKPLSFEVLGATSPSSPAETTNPAASVLNPAMSRWLMGFRSTHDTLSPGWSSWVLMQKLLSGSSPRREEIELAVSEVTAMQFVRK
jgi:hypothetical protein